MFSRLATTFFVALCALSVSAQSSFSIVAPSSSYWWVADSQNLFSWTCGSQYNGGYTNFTVLINNASPAVYAGPVAIIAIQWDYDCSVLVPATTVGGIPAGTGYTLSFANVFNQSDIIATSSQFEIKAAGSAYAPQPSGVASATVTAGANQTGTAASTGTAAASSTAKSSAMATNPAAAGLVIVVMAMIGSALMM